MVTHIELVNRFLRYVEQSDTDAITAMKTADATVWHNDGKGEEPMTRSMENMKRFATETETVIHYEVIRQFAQGNEVLQQHVLHVVPKNGEPSEVHAAMYFRFSNGLLERLEEYAKVLPPQTDGPHLQRLSAL